MSSHFGWVDFAGENQKKMLFVNKARREEINLIFTLLRSDDQDGYY